MRTRCRAFVAYALREDAGMLFVYPRIRTEGVIEAVIMSSLCLVPFAVLLLFLVSRTRRRLSATSCARGE